MISLPFPQNQFESAQKSKNIEFLKPCKIKLDIHSYLTGEKMP